jgi:signal transduction histidine kinase
MSHRPVRTVSDLGLGDHATFIYENETEHRTVVTRFLRQGLERGEKVVYIADTHTPEMILDYLRGDRVDVDVYLERGQLEIHDTAEVYLRGGTFDPESVVELIKLGVEKALAQGYAGLRGTAETNWLGTNVRNSQLILRYETMVSELAEEGRCLFVCQFDRNKFEPEFLLDILHTHPIVIVGTEACDNLYYIAPFELAKHYLPAARFKVCVDNLVARKRMEDALLRSMEQLRHSQKLEALGKLAGGVAHDFKNLIAAITQYAELLQMELTKTDPKREDVDEILNAANRASQLVGQLLAFARRQEFLPQTLNLNSVVENLQSMFKQLAGEDIDLVVLLDPELSSVRVDQGLIEQVLMNLVVNAREAMPEGGSITIKTDNITLEPGQSAGIPDSRPGNFVRLSVIDSGVGMDQYTLEQMFEPFFTTKESGTGLGLSVAYGIIKQHGGWVSVESELERGTKLRIYLPAVRAEKIAKREALRL